MDSYPSWRCTEKRQKAEKSVLSGRKEFFTVRILKHWNTLQRSYAISIFGDLKNLTWAQHWETFKVPPAFSVGNSCGWKQSVPLNSVYSIILLYSLGEIYLHRRTRPKWAAYASTALVGLKAAIQLVWRS